MTYEGWTNWETWNVALHFDNDFALYCSKLEFLHNTDEVTAEAVKAFVTKVLPRGTKDMGGPSHQMRRVSWQELAESWAVDKKELAA